MYETRKKNYNNDENVLSLHLCDRLCNRVEANALSKYLEFIGSQDSFFFLFGIEKSKTENRLVPESEWQSAMQIADKYRLDVNWRKTACIRI